MFSRPLVLINGHAASPARPSSHTLDAQRMAPPSTLPQACAGSASWSSATVTHELLALTRLFKRLMRAQWHRTTPSRLAAATAATPSARLAPLSRRPSAPPIAAARADLTGSDRIPAMLRKGSHPRRLSPVRVDALQVDAFQLDESHQPGQVIGPRMHADPVDPQRVVISGSFAEVCAALDQLVIRQNAVASR